MELDRFQILKSYADSIKTLGQADMRLAQELSYLIIQYGIYGTLPPKETNPIVLALFNQMKLPIDNCRAKSGNAKKTYEKALNQKEIKTESKEIQTEIKTKEKIKRENKKEENNIITLSKDKEEDKSSFGNEDINKCLELIKYYNNGLVDGTKVNQRRFAKHLINKLNQLESIQDGRFTWENTLEIILKVISKNKYYSSKITSPEAIFRNLSLLMNVVKNDISKENTSTVVLESI